MKLGHVQGQEMAHRDLTGDTFRMKEKKTEGADILQMAANDGAIQYGYEPERALRKIIFALPRNRPHETNCRYGGHNSQKPRIKPFLLRDAFLPNWIEFIMLKSEMLRVFFAPQN